MDAKSKTSICKSPFTADVPVAGSCEPPPKYLIMVEGGLPGKMYPLNDMESILGRSVENSIQLFETTVSRKHARFTVDMNGEVGLTDLGSTNGTYVNGQRLLPHAPIWLRNGDRVRFGESTVLKFMSLDSQDERFQRDLFERLVRDPLTGLFNRGYFLDQIVHLKGKCRESGLGLAVMLMDIDHFKTINDSYGHEAGDRVLKEVAQRLRESTRPDDLIARYGGDEIIVALPVAMTDIARERAERIQQQVSDRKVQVGNRHVRVSVSLGMTYGLPNGSRPPHALISEADRALYQAKRNGRNQVSIRSHLVGRDESPESSLHSSLNPFSLIA